MFLHKYIEKQVNIRTQEVHDECDRRLDAFTLSQARLREQECLIQSVMEKHPHGFIVLSEYNANGEHCVIISENCKLYCYINALQQYGRLSYVLESHGLMAISMRVDRLRIEQENIGIGTLLLRALIKIAQQYRCRHINGTISTDDDESDKDIDYQKRLYEKMGFVIETNGKFRLLESNYQTVLKKTIIKL